MKVSVFSQRNVDNQEIVDMILDHAAEAAGVEPIVFLIGGANGAQTILYNALRDEYDFVIFKPWTQISREVEELATQGGKFNSTFFYYRNIQIVDNSDLVIIIDNGEKDAEVYKVKELCNKKNKSMVIINV